MKKFQNLVENRIKHKNNLLQADMKRVYPLNKIQEKVHEIAKGDQKIIDEFNANAAKSPNRNQRPKNRFLKDYLSRKTKEEMEKS